MAPPFPTVSFLIQQGRLWAGKFRSFMEREFAGWHSPPALTLVVANLFPIFAALAWDWPMLTVMVLYWCEMMIIVVISVLKILFIGPFSASYWLSKVILLAFLPFILIPYALLVAVFTAIILRLFTDETSAYAFEALFQGGTERYSLEEAKAILREEFDGGFRLGVAGLVASHLYSFIWNYLFKGECHRAKITALALQPVLRVILPLMVFCYVAIALLAEQPEVVGGQRSGTANIMLVLGIGFKTVFDLHAHLAERRRMAAVGPMREKPKPLRFTPKARP